MSEGLGTPVNWEIILYYFFLWNIVFYYCVLLLSTALSIVYCEYCVFLFILCWFFVYLFVCCLFSLWSLLHIDYCVFIIMNQGSSITDLPKIVPSSRGRSSLSFGTSGPAGISVFKLNPLQKSDLLSLLLINKDLVWRLKLSTWVFYF